MESYFMKKVLVVIIFIAVVACSFSLAFADGIFVKVNAEQVVFPDVQPCIIDGYTYVPVRFLAEAMGCSVTWKDNTAILKLNGQEMRCKLGKDTAIVKDNGQYKNMKIFLYQGRVLVPADFVIQTLKCDSKIEY